MGLTAAGELRQFNTHPSRHRLIMSRSGVLDLDVLDAYAMRAARLLFSSLLISPGYALGKKTVDDMHKWPPMISHPVVEHTGRTP
jgi:hypothetical protein